MGGIVEVGVQTAFEWVQLFGLPVLMVVFFVKGLLVGKVLSTTVFLPGYVIAIDASTVLAIQIAAITAVAYAVGQLVIYAGCRQYGRTFVTRLPFVTVDPSGPEFDRFDEWFSRYGGPSILVTNCMPWVRGTLSIPAGASRYPVGRYVIFTTVSIATYHVGFIFLALGAFDILI